MNNQLTTLTPEQRRTAQRLTEALEIRFLEYYGFDDELCQIMQNRLEIERIYQSSNPDQETAQMLMIENESLIHRCRKTVEYANEQGGR